MKTSSPLKKLALAAVVVTPLFTGCASIVGGTSQVISVETREKGDMLAGASCKLQNDKGVFYVTTPGTVTVHRAYGDLSVKCEKENSSPGLATVKSSTKGMAFGNILFGGVIGVAVDAGSGAAFDYPTMLSIAMGEQVRIETNPPVQDQTTAQNGAVKEAPKADPAVVSASAK